MPNKTLRVKSYAVKTPNLSNAKFRVRTRTSTAKSPYRTKNGTKHVTLRLKSKTFKKRK